MPKNNTKKYHQLINISKQNLESLNDEVISSSKYKILISIGFFIISCLFMGFSIYAYKNNQNDSTRTEQDSLINIRKNIFKSKDRMLKKLTIQEKELSKANVLCANASTELYQSIHPAKLSLENKKETIPLAAYMDYREEKDIKNQLCNERDILTRDVEFIQSEIDNDENQLIKLNSLISSLRKDEKSAYMLALFSMLVLFASIFAFGSYLKSRQMSVSIRLKIDRFRRFQLAATQCDLMNKYEDDPEKQIKTILDAMNISDHIKEYTEDQKGELFTLLGKLKIPQRKSVEVRADLIKAIYSYSDSDK